MFYVVPIGGLIETLTDRPSMASVEDASNALDLPLAIDHMSLGMYSRKHVYQTSMRDILLSSDFSELGFE